MTLTLTDMFCGAGGSSTGAIQVPGVEVRTAMNHWGLAIETHNSNHPDADHIQADISQTDPRYVRHSDILWASPECTNHSVAKGKKRATTQGDLFDNDKPLPDEAAERSRATMWDVPRFAEHHRYRAIITENVVDAARWVMFDAWLMAMDALGYDRRIMFLNSMHAQRGGMPAPQSRDRMYVVFWRKGDTPPNLEPVVRPKAYCPGCDAVVDALQVFKKSPAWGRYRAQYVYRCPNVACRNQVVEPGWLPAAAAIDWALPAERIGDRTRPLSPKTLARILEGLRRYGTPIQLEAGGNQYDAMDPKHPQHGQAGAYVRAWPTDEPLRTLHTASTKGIVLDAVRGAPIISDTDEPFRTQTTSYTRALLMRNNTGGAEMSTPVHEVMRTLTTMGHQSLLVPVEGRDGKQPPTVLDAMRTQTTRNETGLLIPYYGASKSARPTTETMGTLTTVDRYALVTLRGQNAPKRISEPMDVTQDDVMACRFRMLEPHEIKRGMAFPDEYVMLGTKREQVKMAG
ncbi:MAG TPA: DNA cytosine methyltransferase, partial [Intrasporangium sp.]|uniref:DNA cytosine methyltransferase n=1 Tax=Intrasporangium sp. TaxID=1925024 RepID=UPI002D783023